MLWAQFSRLGRTNIIIILCLPINEYKVPSNVFQQVIYFFSPHKGLEYLLLDLFQDPKSSDALLNIFFNIAFS